MLNPDFILHGESGIFKEDSKPCITCSDLLLFAFVFYDQSEYWKLTDYAATVLIAWCDTISDVMFE